MTLSLPLLGLRHALEKSASDAEKNYEELKNRLTDNQARDTAIITKLSDDLDAAQNVTDENGNPVAQKRVGDIGGYMMENYPSFGMDAPPLVAHAPDEEEHQNFVYGSPGEQVYMALENPIFALNGVQVDEDGRSRSGFSLAAQRGYPEIPFASYPLNMIYTGREGGMYLPGYDWGILGHELGHLLDWRSRVAKGGDYPTLQALYNVHPIWKYRIERDASEAGGALVSDALGLPLDEARVATSVGLPTYDIGRRQEEIMNAAPWNEMPIEARKRRAAELWQRKQDFTREREKVRREAAEAQRFYRAIQEKATELWDTWDKGRPV